MSWIALKKIAKIDSGFAFRSKILPKIDGEYQVIQSRDIRDDLTLDAENLTRVSVPTRSRPEGKLVQKDDILLMARSQNPYAVHLDVALPQTLAQGSFCTIRLNDTSAVLPEYLAMLLNQKSTQNALKSLIKGTTVAFLKISDLREFSVPIPSAERQRTFVGMRLEIEKEVEVRKQLEEQQILLLEGYLALA